MNRHLPILRIALAIILSSTNAFARLGETLDECDVRYGRMTGKEASFRPEFPQYIYVKNDVEIRIRFVAAKAGELTISSERGLPEKLIAEILAANTQGSQWRIDSAASREPDKLKIFTRYWAYSRADGQAIANYGIYETGFGILTIRSAAFIKAFHAPASGF